MLLFIVLSCVELQGITIPDILVYIALLCGGGVEKEPCISYGCSLLLKIESRQRTKNNDTANTTILCSCTHGGMSYKVLYVVDRNTD